MDFWGFHLSSDPTLGLKGNGDQNCKKLLQVPRMCLSSTSLRQNGHLRSSDLAGPADWDQQDINGSFTFMLVRENAMGDLNG